MHRHGQRGVSLIELVVSVAIIGICVLVAVPRMLRYDAATQRWNE